MNQTADNSAKEGSTVVLTIGHRGQILWTIVVLKQELKTKDKKKIIKATQYQTLNIKYYISTFYLLLPVSEDKCC